MVRPSARANVADCTAFDEPGAQLAWEITASMRSLMRRLMAYTSPRSSVGDLGDLGDRRMMTVEISDAEP